MSGYEDLNGWEESDSSDSPIDDTINDPSVKHNINIEPNFQESVEAKNVAEV